MSKRPYDEEAAQALPPRCAFSALVGFIRSRCQLFATRTPKDIVIGPNMRKSVTRALEQAPDGYPRIASFQSSDRSFLQFRGFHDLHCRVLLTLQYDIERLERELDQLDRSDASSTSRARQKCLISIQEDREEAEWERTHPSSQTASTKRARPVVVEEIRAKLTEYDDFMDRTRTTYTLPRPSSRDYKSLIYWFEANKPLLLAEMRWVQRKEDIVTLRTGREAAAFEECIERLLGVIDRFLTRKCHWNIIKVLFASPELREKTTDKYLRYYSPARIDGMVNIIISVLVFVLLIIPVIVMSRLSSEDDEANPFQAIGILIVFTLLFGLAMCSLTKASRQELFAASAAYCAVLVVFISNFTTQQVEIVSHP